MSSAEVDMSKAVCIECGYALRDLEKQRCPECGRAFEPGDSSTFNVSGGVKSRRRWAKPPSVAEGCLAAIFTALVLIVFSIPPGARFMSLVPLLVCGGPIWLGVVVTFVKRIRVSRREHRPSVNSPSAIRERSRVRWLPVPLMLIVLVTCFVYPWPLLIRFWLSQAAFKQAVKDHAAGNLTTPCRIGLFRVRTISRERQGGAIKFITGQPYFDPFTGFVYDPCKASAGWGFGGFEMTVAKGWFLTDEP